MSSHWRHDRPIGAVLAGGNIHILAGALLWQSCFHGNPQNVHGVAKKQSGTECLKEPSLKGSGHNAFLLFYTNFQNGNASKKSVAGITTIACIKACCWWLLVRYYDAMSVVQVDVSYYNNSNNNNNTTTATTTTTVGWVELGWCRADIQLKCKVLRYSVRWVG